MDPQITVVDNDPNGILKLELAGWDGVAYRIPKNKFKNCENIADLQKPGVYVFTWKDEDEDHDYAYVGMSKDLLKRVKDRPQWQNCVMFLSDSFYSAHASYLENKVFLMALMGRYKMSNNQVPPGESLNSEDEKKMEKFIEPLNEIMKYFGYDVLQSRYPNRVETLSEEEKKYNGTKYCFRNKGDRPDAIGIDTPEGFIVLKGSLTSFLIAPGFTPRIDMENERIIDPISKIFTRSVVFKNKKEAATVVDGCKSSSGGNWKNV